MKKEKLWQGIRIEKEIDHLERELEKASCDCPITSLKIDYNDWSYLEINIPKDCQENQLAWGIRLIVDQLQVAIKVYYKIKLELAEKELEAL